ncbi:hypothetical protein EDL99_11215 [Ornithobacterium rhinotracheale]|uniref:hypothetical protein n=1 Tax=Ornithobacterium rhinotracheale TaxID=28251 RepID=UPI00129C7F5C|nr:hypothetical protein [Ornithobacterium rhinotracheale]MRJ09418.1 hypothetical protein [Ornithobacterium rhinotracheale]UOH77286.1 hypothetical protein MT996_08705 [Ornithobacterium rhinotracheale]
MKYSTIIGLVLLVVGLVLYIVQAPEYTEPAFYVAGFLGLGVGLLFGGFMGYAQKKRQKIVNQVVAPAPQTKEEAPTVIENKIEEQ